MAVLLGSFNGERFIGEQLDSIARQLGVKCSIHVSDDGSSDATLDVVRRWSVENPGILLTEHQGPGIGYVANFLSLLSMESIESPFYALSDQDDVWDAEKLSRALKALVKIPSGIPALYCSRTRSINRSGQTVGYSPLFRRSPGLKNALVQNIAGGNTMVMNREARNLIAAAGMVTVPSHDWWCYLLVCAGGGTVIYDAYPSVQYRQHDRNLIGANTGFARRTARYRDFLAGRNRRWSAMNLAALSGMHDCFPQGSRKDIDCFKQLHDGSFWSRVKAWKRGGFYAQTISANLGLFVATLLKKM